LIEGESGSGKELAARVVHDVLDELGRHGPLVSLNAACFAGEDDAVATIFGVSDKAFTGVGGRRGALVEAGGGTLFLDEVHNLPPRAQRSLLRFAEDGLVRHLGEDAKPRSLDVRLVLGTNNLPVERACEEGRLAADLVARLHRVRIPALRERRADVPSIFCHVIRVALGPERVDEVSGHIDASVMERLCLHDYTRGNVRELEDIAAVIRARLEEGELAAAALAGALDAALGPRLRRSLLTRADRDSELSLYERHREEITDVYKTTGDNLSLVETVLHGRGIKVNRRWLATYLDRWGLRTARRRS
jgi:DNA-binding NtrC family response regulator